MKSKRGFSCILLAIFTSLMLIGCGKKEEITEDGKAVVRFVVGGSAAELEQYQKAVDAFNEQSKTTQVTIVGVPGDNYNEKVMTQLSSKTPPDCFYAEEGSFGELNKSGVLLDLTEYLEKEDSALKTADIPKNILETFTYEEKVHGVPVDCNPMVVYYNADLFKELGLKSPQQYYEEGSWNFAALQSVSEQLRDAGKIGFVYENWWGPLYSFLRSQGDELYAADLSSSTFDSDRVKNGLTYLNDNIQSKAFTYAGKLESGESPDTLFMSGQAGMLYAGRWFVSDFKELSFQYDVVPFPYYEQPEEEISAMPASPLVINKKTTNPDAAWEFVSYYCGQSGQRLRMEGAGNAVPTIDGLDDIVVTGEPEHAQYFLDAVDISFLYPMAETLNPGLTDSITEEVEKLLTGLQDVDETLKNIVDTVNKTLQGE